MLGGAFVLQGRLDEAIVQYRKAVQLDPDRLRLHGSTSDWPWPGRDIPLEAIAELREAIRHDRQNPKSHHVLAAILVSLGRSQGSDRRIRRGPSPSARSRPGALPTWRSSEIGECIRRCLSGSVESHRIAIHNPDGLRTQVHDPVRPVCRRSVACVFPASERRQQCCRRWPRTGAHPTRCSTRTEE